MKETISVIVQTPGGRRTEEIEYEQIEYIKPELGACTIIFLDGRRIYVLQEFEEIMRLIRVAKGM